MRFLHLIHVQLVLMPSPSSTFVQGYLLLLRHYKHKVRDHIWWIARKKSAIIPKGKHGMRKINTPN